MVEEVSLLRQKVERATEESRIAHEELVELMGLMDQSGAPMDTVSEFQRIRSEAETGIECLQAVVDYINTLKVARKDD